MDYCARPSLDVAIFFQKFRFYRKAPWREKRRGVGCDTWTDGGVVVLIEFKEPSRNGHQGTAIAKTHYAQPEILPKESISGRVRSLAFQPRGALGTARHCYGSRNGIGQPGVPDVMAIARWGASVLPTEVPQVQHYNPSSKVPPLDVVDAGSPKPCFRPTGSAWGRQWSVS